MNLDTIVAELKNQRQKLDAAIQALERTQTKKRVGRPIGSGRRHMSAAARARISAAMKARWAKRKKAA